MLVNKLDELKVFAHLPHYKNKRSNWVAYEPYVRKLIYGVLFLKGLQSILK